MTCNCNPSPFLFTFKNLGHPDLGDELAGSVEQDCDDADHDGDGNDNGGISLWSPAVELTGPHQAGVVHLLEHRETSTVGETGVPWVVVFHFLSFITEKTLKAGINFNINLNHLTLSPPCLLHCHSEKTTNKRAKLEIVKAFLPPLHEHVK